MLDEYKAIYKAQADNLLGWEDIDRNELCFQYLENENTGVNTDPYLAAIICKFWELIPRYYHSQGIKQASEQDCYDWLIESIMYCLEHRVWTDESNSLYGNPRAPEMCVNTCMNSLSVNFFTAVSRQKRRLNYNCLSLDSILESGVEPDIQITSNTDSNTLTLLKARIVEYFKLKDYFTAFILDAVINYNLSDKLLDEKCSIFSRKKLEHHLRGINEMYCYRIASDYNLSVETVLHALTYLKRLNYTGMSDCVNRVLNNLRRDKDLLEIIGV